MNVVTGRSDMNPKHFTPYEVNLMVLNRYNNVRQQLHTVIHMSNSGRKISLKTNCRNIDLSLWGNISLSFPPSHCHLFSMFFIFCYISQKQWCSLNHPYQIQSIFLSRTTDVGQIVPTGYLPPLHAIIFAIPDSFTSSLLCLSRLHLCYPVSSYVTLSLVLQSQTFDSRKRSGCHCSLFFPRTSHLDRKRQFDWQPFSLTLFAILHQVFYLFFGVWILLYFVPQHSSTWFLWVCG